ncbi:MAG: hypothetical protein A2902_05290 [Elusimicrobia bacterium RIFCSPLOWO2_01_FULL_64_13]|nr:MAG: hypothetical protein A2902_05290 [Elusimicrobia bacterium RIFCSPLOWO2_01_FULL_64_13]
MTCSAHGLGRALFPAALLFLASCSRAVVAVKPGYDSANIRRVALLGFADFPSVPGSGESVSGVFEKALLRAGYQVVERRRIDEVLKERGFELSGAVDPATARELGRMLGVDALILGGISAYAPQKKNIVFVDIHEQTQEPIFEKETKRLKKGDKWVTVEEEVFKGTRTETRVTKMPQTYIQEAEVGLAVRMVDVKSAELLWVGTDFEEALNVQAAAEIIARRILNAAGKTRTKR